MIVYLESSMSGYLSDILQTKYIYSYWHWCIIIIVCC